MSLCFCPDVKNEDELLQLLKQGRWDREIYDYLIEIMSEKDGKVLPYGPVELFEMQARLQNKNEILVLQFWNAQNSGDFENGKYTMSKKQRELFNLFVLRINEIYQSLLRLVSSEKNLHGRMKEV